jgi:hypothetical protein
MSSTCDDDLEVNSASTSDKRSQFGNRYLTDASHVFDHNAWDNVTWSDEQQAAADAIVRNQITHRVDAVDADRCVAMTAQAWNQFYATHSNRFFMNRNWLFTEFPELAAGCKSTNTEVCVDLL